MVVYRLSNEKYAKKLSGFGAALYGGRWNKKGTELIYCAENRSLALCEMLVHISKNLRVPNLLFLSVNLGKIKNIPTIELPNKQLSNHKNTQTIGEEFVIQNKHLAIRVPSIIIPEEYNIIINPAHSKFQEVKIEKRKKFVVDQRLVGI